MVLVQTVIILIIAYFGTCQYSPRRGDQLFNLIKVKREAELRSYARVNQNRPSFFGNSYTNATFPWSNLSDDLDTWLAPLEIRQNYPYYLAGYDEEGRPIWIGELGKWNVRRIVEAGDVALRNFDKYFEQAAYRCVKSLGDRSTIEAPVNDAIMIADFDHFNIFQTAHVPTVAHILGLARKYRPVIAKHLHVGIGLNTNAIATTLVNLIRPTLGSIFEKTEIYGTNKSRWIPRLLKYCPRDQLPEWYGGVKNFQPVKVYG